MRKMKGALLITVVMLASEPTWAQPPNEVYSFDVISDILTGAPGCLTGCPVQTPYHLATLTVTHKAFARNHAASLTNPPTVNNGVVSLEFSVLQGLLNWPPTSPLLPPFLKPELGVEVQLGGNDISGNIDSELVVTEGPILSMRSGIDDHWIGQFSTGGIHEVHNFVATAMRVPQGQVSR